MNNNPQHISILIANGVNLSHIGSREINIYGSTSFVDFLSQLRQDNPDIDIQYFQTDEEGKLAETIANAKGYDGIILNAGAYTHTSIILADAVKTTSCKVIEVHISNLYGRENYRRNSLLAGCCDGFISGFGLDSYRLAIDAIKIKCKIH